MTYIISDCYPDCARTCASDWVHDCAPTYDSDCAPWFGLCLWFALVCASDSAPDCAMACVSDCAPDCAMACASDCAHDFAMGCASDCAPDCALACDSDCAPDCAMACASDCAPDFAITEICAELLLARWAPHFDYNSPAGNFWVVAGSNDPWRCGLASPDMGSWINSAGVLPHFAEYDPSLEALEGGRTVRQWIT